MSAEWWHDRRGDLHWWEHRHPNPNFRFIGAAIMIVGAMQIVLGVAILTHHP